MEKLWKDNWQESRQNYLKWWNGQGLVISMWEFVNKEGKPHQKIRPPVAAKDLNQFWFDPKWRAQNIHYQMSRSSYKADILPVALTHLGPVSLSAILGAELQSADDTIWLNHDKTFGDEIELDKNNKWWKLHQDLLKECKVLSNGHYFVGMPDLVEGIDVLIGLKGTEAVLMDMLLRPDILAGQLQKINDIYFKVFDRLYDIIQEDGESAFCYFSIWGPGKVSKLQCDASVMISESDFQQFAIPYLREQCEKLDYTLYHLDGVNAIRHLDAILEIDKLNAIQWTPGFGQPQGGDPCWYDLYKKILAQGKSIMPCWVEVEELKPLLDNVGNEGLNIMMHFESEKDIDAALKIADAYR